VEITVESFPRREGGSTTGSCKFAVGMTFGFVRLRGNTVLDYGKCQMCSEPREAVQHTHNWICDKRLGFD
jgi:hypothetical protein